MDFLSLFTKINILLSLSSIVIFLLHRLSTVQFFKFSYLYRLQISYLLIILSLALPIAVPHLSIQVGGDAASIADLATGGGSNYWAVTISKVKNSLTIDPEYISTLTMILILLVSLGLCLFFIQIAGLCRKSSQLQIFKKLGSVYLAVQPEETSPYVYSILNKKFIVLPSYLMADKQLLIIAVKHELQHIRQQDTRWIYLLNFVLLGFYVNPLVHLLIRNIKNTQELACDEELVLNKKVKFKSYIQSLLKIAELVQERKSAPFFANTILREGNQSNLRERVEMMIKVRKNRNKGYMAGLVLFTAFFMMGASAYAVKDINASSARKKQIMFEMVQMEEGKVISQPRVISLEGEPAIISISDSSGNGMSMSIVAWIYGDRVEMRMESKATKNHIVGKTEVFNVEVRNKVTWNMDYQQDGRNLSIEVTPTIQ